jgi:nitrite reductase/ring-hydroxylating ferredoxin subunit
MGEFTTVTALDALEGRELAAFGVSGNRVAIARVGGAFYAFGDTCTHQGCSLADGELEETTVTCPCHGSQFNVTTGDVLRGPPASRCGATPFGWRTARSGSRSDTAQVAAPGGFAWRDRYGVIRRRT